MKKEEIHLSDIQRILFGQAPPEFLVEVLVRTLIIYLAFLVAVRLLGKRMSGQLTLTELAVIVTLGAIVAVPMQLPDRGLIQGLVILACAVLFQRGITWISSKNKKAEHIIAGTETLLVKDGVLQLESLEKTRIPRQQLFSQLRSKSIYNLGKVQRLYLEASGDFSAYQFPDERPGLSVIPPDDQEALKSQKLVGEEAKACCNCGTVAAVSDQACSTCGRSEWTSAVV